MSRKDLCFLRDYSQQVQDEVGNIIRDKLQNAYVLESDLVLSNPELIRKYDNRNNVNTIILIVVYAEIHIFKTFFTYVCI